MSRTIEGRHAVAEALRAGMPLGRVLVAEGVGADAALEAILEAAADRGVTVERRPRRELDALSVRGAHQGVVAEAEDFAHAALSDVLAGVEDAERCLIIALDHVTDPGNLGAVARSAEVAGAAAVIVETRRSAAIGPAAYKASAGAIAHVPVVAVTNLARTLATLKAAGFWVAGASEKADTIAWDAPLDGRLVLVLGAEDKGLSRLVRETCDFLVALPVAGGVGSLNVAQAATVLAFEWVRRGR